MIQSAPPLGPKVCGTVGRFARDTRGATIVEFAIVALPFFAILFAVLSASLTFFAQQSIETVTATLGRSLLTGETRAGTMTKAQFKALACAKLPPYLRCSNLLVSVDRSSDFASVSTAAPAVTFAPNGAVIDSAPYNLGAAGDILTLRLFYVWPLPSISLGFDLSTLPNGRRLLIATSVTKTEQYS